MPKLLKEALNELPERENLKKSLRRDRRKNLSANSKKLSELQIILVPYFGTVEGETFFIYDNQSENRILVCSIRGYLKLLAQSRIRFMDGTFKLSQTIFTQIFTVLNLCDKN